MSNFKRIDDEKYISNLFRNLSRKKEIPATILFGSEHIKANIFFPARHGFEPSLKIIGKNGLKVRDEIEITFNNNEVLFLFQTKITSLLENDCSIEKPQIIFSTFRRLMTRYKVRMDEESLIIPDGSFNGYRIIDISSKGLSFEARYESFEVNKIMRENLIKLGSSIEAVVDGEIRHCIKKSDGYNIYGLSFRKIDWGSYNQYFKYVMGNVYPRLKNIGEISEAEASSLIEKRIAGNLEGTDLINNLQKDKISNIRSILKNPEISHCYVFYNNMKPLATGSVLRIYESTFLGQGIIASPYVKLKPRISTEVYLGLADFMLNNPNFEFYLKYITQDLPWHQELFQNMESIINCSDRFIFDKLQLFECKINEADFHKVIEGYSVQSISNPAEFIEYSRASLKPLIANCYGYNKDHFYLNEISRVYESAGSSVKRKLWRICSNLQVIGYAVAEAYLEAIELYNVDICRVYFTKETSGTEIKTVLDTLLPKVKDFYREFKKDRFSLFFKAWDQVAKDIKLPGLDYKCEAGRVLMNIEGLAEYKKLLGENFVNYVKYYPLTHPQLAIWYTEKVYPGTCIWNNCFTVTIKDEIDYKCLEKAINLVIERCDALRTKVTEIDNQPMQYFTKYMYRKIDYFDFSRIGEDYGYQQWDESNTSSPMNPVDSQLFYFAMIKISDKKGGFYIKTHHLLTDAWSKTLIISKIIEYYSQLKKGAFVPKKNMPSYTTFVLTEEEYKTSEKFKEQKLFWDKKFETVPEFTSFKPSNGIYRSVKAVRKTFILSKELTDKIQGYCADTKNSVFSVFLAVLDIYINRITGKKDIVVATPILNRSNPREKNTAGVFISTIPVRIDVNPNACFNSFIKNITKEWKVLLKNQKYPYDLILREYRERHKSSDNLFDIVLSYQNAKFDKLENMTDYETKWHFNGNQSDSLDIHISDRESDGQYILDFDYLLDVFTAEDIENMYSQMFNLLSDAMENPNKKLCQLDILLVEERNRIIYKFNDTSVDYKKDKPIHKLFEEQALKTPESIALAFKESYLSYAELNERSNKIARILREKGVERNQIVGLMVKRSFEMIIGIMAVLKAGGAYLPIDPEYPEERVQYMLEDSDTRLLLTQRDLKNKIDFSREILELDDKSLYEGNGMNLSNISNSSDLAYTIYTSGSTGRPKGVMLEHRSVVNFIKGITDSIEFVQGNSILALTTISFDIFVLETLLPLAKGLRIVIADEDEQKDPKLLSLIISESNIDLLQMTPSRMQILTSYDKKLSCLKKLKAVMIGGEPFPPALLNQLRSINCFKIYNMYGPTETTVWSTVKDLTDAETINIGKPIANTQIYILDDNNSILPVGSPGELCIGGDGLARGYLNRPELTNEKFVRNPFNPKQRIYKTGDLAKWQRDGSIECLGRIDNQVKIRGFRIELGEIESLIKSYAAVNEAVVDLIQDSMGNKNLCAFYISDNDVEVSMLREFLNSKLPDYMVPTYFVQLDTIPYTPNGKVDKKALPKPTANMHAGCDYIAPENEIEQKLCEIWREILGIERVGTADKFFEIGGDSLKAVSLVSRIHKDLNKGISISRVFKTPTIKELSKLCSEEYKSLFSSIKKVKEMECYPASKAQIRMFLLNDMDKKSICYNMPCVLEFEGKIDAFKLETAFNMLFERHESLRTSFYLEKGEIVQKIHPTYKFILEHRKMAQHELIDFERKYIKPFDLGCLPLFRSTLVETENGKHRLFIDMHHIISDGMSFGILFKELAELYKGKTVPMPKCRYRDFSVWQTEMLGSENIKTAEKYWLKTFEGDIPVLNMPTDFKRPTVQSFAGGRHKFNAGKELTGKLERLADSAGITMYMLLLACFNVMLSKYTSQEDIVVGSPVAGRDHAELENVVGMFVNTLPMRNKPLGEKTFPEFLAEVKLNTLEAFENRAYQFEELVNKLAIPRDMGRNPLFDIMFVFQNTDMMQEIEIEGNKTRLRGLEFNISKFDITMQALKIEQSLEFELEYAVSLYSEATAFSLAGHYINILENITKNPQQRLYEIEMISEEEKTQVLYQFNDTKFEYPKDKTVHQLFEEQVLKTPDNIAVVYGDESLTYQELNGKANCLAFKLREKGVKQESIVAVLMKPSIEMFIGILGILKSGGGYVPIDPDYPEDRIEYILNDSNAVMLLSSAELIKKCNLSIEYIDINNFDLYNMDNLDNFSLNNSIAYLIYTSGSTGKPKGVIIEHRSLINLCYWHNHFYKISDKDIATKYAGVGFDASVWEIFPYLLIGASIHVINNELRLDIEKLNEYIELNGITISFLPTQICERFIELDNKSLKMLLTGGDKLRSFRNKSYSVFNNYGPTENTVVTTSYLVTEDTDNIPIGKPIHNTKIFVLDKWNNILPIGVAGELCVSGDSLARGYYGNEALTEEKFVKCSFPIHERIYKTGDLARWLPDGNLEFLGRLDSQVKIRGFRIELGEIEKCLLEKLLVDEVVVVDRLDERENKYLSSYYVAEHELSSNEIRSKLLEFLPEYMIPTFFIRVDRIPVTQNGKIDRKALPEPNRNGNTEIECISPTNDTEEKLIDLFKEILGVDTVGINDNFFERGGDSISAMRLIAGAFQFDWNLNMQDFYRYRTVHELSDKIRGEIKETKLVKDAFEGISKKTKSDLIFKNTSKGRKNNKVNGVLLCGATGFLGAHILNELLQDKKTKVYCLVRGENYAACEKRLLDILDFYFGSKYADLINRRIFPVNGDITLDKFGLEEEKYSQLGQATNSVIHTAALVKHYGNYSEFEKLNVNGTREVIDFCRRFETKLSYISTTSVSGNSVGGEFTTTKFTENDFYVGQDYMKNVYVRSKFEAEKIVFEAYEKGLDTYIFRVGNLTGRYLDGHFQKNIEENNFYNVLKSVINLHLIADELLEMQIEFTPVDLCGKAIVEILRSGMEEQRVFHIFNHKMLTMRELIEKLRFCNINIDVLDAKTYRDFLKTLSKKSDNRELMTGVVNNLVLADGTQIDRNIELNSEITFKYLRKNGFEWPEISEIYIEKLMNYIRKVEYIKI